MTSKYINSKQTKDKTQAFYHHALLLPLLPFVPLENWSGDGSRLAPQQRRVTGSDPMTLHLMDRRRNWRDKNPKRVLLEHENEPNLHCRNNGFRITGTHF